MEIKIDTKEKFKVITPQSSMLNDNIANELDSLCINILENDKTNLIIKLNLVNEISDFAIEKLQELGNTFYGKNLSFVVCELNSTLLKTFKEKDILDNFNYAPSESEAWDIVQLEEIERELFSDED